MAQPNLLKDILNDLLKSDIQNDFNLIKSLHADVLELGRRSRARGDHIKQLQTFVGSTVATQYLNLMLANQDEDLEKNRTLMRLISETQIKVLKTISILAKMDKD